MRLKSKLEKLTKIAEHNGLFPLWTTLNWLPKNFRISKKDSNSLCRIPNPADSNQNFSRIFQIFMVFLEFRSNFTKFRGNTWISSQAYRALARDSQCHPQGVCGYFLE